MGIQINTQPQVFTSLSSTAITATNYYDKDGNNIVNKTDTLFSAVTSITGSKVSTPSLSAQTLTAGSGVFNSISATSISATSISAFKFYGDGSGLTNIVGLGAGVTSINGLTGILNNVVFSNSATNFSQSITGTSATFTTSVSSPAISAGKFTGDGSGLTGVVGVAAGVTSLNGLTGVVTNVVTTSGATLTGSLLAPALSSQTLTAGVATFTTSVSSPSISAVTFNVSSTGNYLSGGTNLVNIFGQKTAVDSTFSIVTAKSANWDSTYSTVNSNSADWSIGKTLSSSGGKLGGNTTIQGNLTANYITALSGSTFVNTVFTTTSALCVVGNLQTGPALYVGANGTGDIASFYDIDQNIEVLHIGGYNSVASPNVGIHTSTPNKTFTVFGEISSSGNVWFNNVIANNDLTAKRATFTTSVSSPAISAGKFTGDGSGLTGVVGVAAGVTSLNGLTGVVTNVVTTSGATLTGNLLAPALSSQTLTAGVATFTTSVSSPAINATSLTVSGYPLSPITSVYSVATGATSTYTLALSDNNNTITLNLGTSGVVSISNSISYPVGYQTNVLQLSTGRVTLSAGSGLTLKNDLSSYITFRQYSTATILNVGNNLWVCYGSLST